jgi:hypothetical protein
VGIHLERDRTSTGIGMGMIMALLMGVLLLGMVAWWAVTQSGLFGPTTNVNITQNQPADGSSGGSGSTGGTTGGQTAGRPGY